MDDATGLAFGMDLTPLITDPSMDVGAYVQTFIDRFANDVQQLIANVR